MISPASFADLLLLLDENISPNIVARLWEAGIDAVAVRDRAMLRISDPQVLNYAQKENRAVVTINLADFEKLVAQRATHTGVISIPSGGSREEQFGYIKAAAEWARKYPNAMGALRDRIVEVDEDERVTSKIVSAPRDNIRSFPNQATRPA